MFEAALMQNSQAYTSTQAAIAVLLLQRIAVPPLRVSTIDSACTAGY
jgi:hypothetical protein